MRFRPFLCLLVCLISTNAFTQTLTFSDPPLGISRSSAEVGVADFDGDGFNDIAVANASQRWYRGPNFTEWFTIGTADGGPYAAQVADVNGDGYADFVTSDGARNEADYPGHVYLYLNPRGTGGDVTQPWTRIVVYSGNVRHQNDMRLVDIDGDGRLDILEKTWSATERVLIAFQNADINNWTVRTFDTGETGKPEGISAGDLDGGGDVEIVQSGVYWKSSGNWRTDTFEQYSIDLAFYASTYDKTKSEVGDLDNDGDLDVYLGSAEGSELKLAWYENTGLGPGGGIAWTEHLIKDNTGDYHGIALKDIDQDGDIDLVAGKGFGQKGCSVFYNNNNGASWTEQNFDPDGNLYTLQVADLDADGDLDIVGPNGFNDPVKYYLNETPADPPVAPTGLIASLKNGRNVLLNWTDNSAEEGAYLLERIAGNDWQLLASLPANTTSFLDETTQPATAYRYRVRATNGGGASENAVSETLTTWAEAGTISANPPAGNFLDPPLVTLSGMLPSGEIRYTLDGSIPNATSPLYTTPLLLEQSLLLRAVALGPMLLPSEEFSGFYNVAIDGNFPPLADAGPDQALVSLSEVLLDGSNSVDFDDPLDSLVFSWSQISGPPANLVGIEEDSARFTPTLVGDYVFELTVADEASDDRDTVLIQVADLDADLVAYWPFNEPSGMVASEIVDGKNATLTTGNSFSEGLFGNALAVDGENGRAEAPAIDVLGDSLTITAWIKAADLDNVEGRIVSKAAGTNGNDHIWMLSQNGGSALRFRLNTGGPTTTLISESGVLTAGEWTFIAAVYDGQEMRLYRDLELVARTPKTGGITQAPTVGVSIGNQPTGAGDRPFSGLIDEVKIYAAALTTDQLEELFGASVVLPVSWLSFSAEARGKTGFLRWETEEETENTGFYVERTGEADFTDIGFVPAGSGSYSFVDVAPLSGQNFYRLRQVDVDGSFSFSPTVNLTIQEELWIYPVPARTSFTIEAVSGHYYRVLDANGRIVHKGKITGARTQVPCEGWKSGAFLVEVLDNSDTVIGRGRVVR